jgi:hypothetical protein
MGASPNEPLSNGEASAGLGDIGQNIDDIDGPLDC